MAGLVLSLTALAGAAEQTLRSVPASQAPVIDGVSDDAAWAEAPAVMTRDAVAGIEITLKSVHRDGRLYLLARFPDATENREHKTMTWDPQLGLYRTGPKREDTLVVKWSMEPFPVDLSLRANRPYRADIWFWKAFRTDHAGYADDKMHVYSIVPIPMSQKVLSASGQVFYLYRPGDRGTAAYQALVHDRHISDSVARYRLAEPSGSRADVRAKGRWEDGVWTVEFARALDTGALDDVRFEPGKRYRFGVSRFEIAGRPKNPDLEQPEYGSGDVGEHLTLEIVGPDA